MRLKASWESAIARPALKDDEIQSFRRQICDVARELFARNGFEAVTMRAIAREAGCSPAKPYSYFDGKTGILAATRARCFDDFVDFVEQRLDGVDGAEPRLEAQARAYVEFARREPQSFKIMFDFRLADAEDHSELRASVRRSWDLLRGGVRDALDAGVIEGDVDDLAHLMWSGLHGIAALENSGTPGPDWDADRLTIPMIEALIDAHRPESNDTRAED